LLDSHNPQKLKRPELENGFQFQVLLVFSSALAIILKGKSQALFVASFCVLRRLGTGLGIIHRSDMFAAVDDTVTLPGYTRLDAAVYYSLSEKWRLQANLENLLNMRYYLNADGNNNISPGRSRGLRIDLRVRF